MDPRSTHGAFSWMELQGKNAAQTQTFYSELFGWNPVPMPMQDGSTYPAFALGETPLGGFADKTGIEKQWLPYITVEDVDATVAKADSAGGKVLNPAFDAPGVGRIAVLADPSGAATAVIQYPKG